MKALLLTFLLLTEVLQAQSGSVSGARALYVETDGPVTMTSYDVGTPYLWPIGQDLVITFVDTLVGYPDHSGLIPQWLEYQGAANRSGYIDFADTGQNWQNFGNFSLTIPAFTFTTPAGVAASCAEWAYYVREIATGNLFGLHEYVAITPCYQLGFTGPGYDGYEAVAFGSEVVTFLQSVPEPEPVALVGMGSAMLLNRRTRR